VHPILTWLPGPVPRPIGSYGVLLAAAMVVGALGVVRAAVRGRLDGGATVAVVGLATGGAMAGAFVLHALVEWLRTGQPFAGVHQPGLVFFGAPVAGFATAALSCRALALPLGRLLDLSVPALAVAHALGRIGCFLGGCCYGKPWDGWLAVRYTDPLAPAAYPSVLRHPVPLYEAAILLALALAFAVWPARRIGDGRRFVAYWLAYAVARFGLELVRGDAVRGVWLGGWGSTSQLLAVGAVLGGGALLWWRGWRPRPGLVSTDGAR
ncbi:MAG: prolipoprotein diacylglyceryl transferase, partial [Myxococcota bacterium]